MAINLDSRADVTALDPKGMLRLTDEFPTQCRKALELSLAVNLAPLSTQPTLAMLTGLGGSAAGGDFTKALFDAEGKVPFVVNRDYNLPKFVGPNTIVFCTSYSGNTEETLSAYADAKAAGAQIVCVTSGGKLKAQAEADGYPVFVVPGGQPRARRLDSC